MTLFRLRLWSMKCCVLFLLPFVVMAQSQSSSGSYTFDVNGNRVSAGESHQSVSKNGDTTSTQMGVTMNGNSAPREKVEEKLISKTETSKVVERVVTPYDDNGNPGQPQRMVTSERKNSDGSTSTDRAVYYSDINGNFTLGEKETKVSRPAGEHGSTYETTLVRGTPNGEVVVERQQGRVVASKTSSHEDVSIERRDVNGNLQPAGRLTIAKEEKDGVVKESKAMFYQDGGQMRLTNQTVSETQTRKDGSSVTKVDVFGPNPAGRAAADPPEFREQQIIEKIPGPNKSLSETYSIRRPTLDGAGALGPIQKVSERNCTGQCNTP